MKSRIIAVQEIIMAYKLKNQSDKLNKIAQKLNVKLIELAENSAEQQLGYLVGFKGFEKTEKEGTSEISCLIFSGIANKKLDKILAALREEQLEIPYKAVVTATNQSWSLKKLTAELVKEREKLGG